MVATPLVIRNSGPDAFRPPERGPGLQTTGLLDLAAMAGDHSDDRPERYFTYEEYHPFGTTSWWATNGSTDVSAKRYRYTGKERDDETGLGYHGARYYAAWLGRWERPDPSGTKSGLNRYEYVKGRPVGSFDPTGNAEVPSEAVLRPQVLYPVGFVGPLPSGAGHEAYPGQGSIPAALRPGRDALWNAANPVPEPKEVAIAGPGGVGIIGPTERAYDAQARMQAAQATEINAVQSSSLGGALVGGAAAAAGGTIDQIGAASKAGVAAGVGIASLGGLRASPGATQGIDLSPSVKGGFPEPKTKTLGVVEQSSNVVRVRATADPKSPGFARGTLDRSGELHLSVYAEDAREQGFKDVSGGFAAQEMVSLLNPTKIVGEWGAGTNLNKFMQEGGGPRATYETNVNAAKATWTGQQAAKAGFTEVEDVTFPVIGQTGFSVEAVFVRPGDR